MVQLKEDTQSTTIKPQNDRIQQSVLSTEPRVGRMFGHNILHIWIPTKQDLEQHFLIPTYSQLKMDSSTLAGLRSENSVFGPTSESGIFDRFFDARLMTCDSGYGSRSESILRDDATPSTADDRPLDELFDTQISERTDSKNEDLTSVIQLAHEYSESISLCILQPTVVMSYVTAHETARDSRYKQELHMRTGYRPTGYSQRLVVLVNSTRKKYKNTVYVHQVPKPARASETCITRPARNTVNYSTNVDYSCASKAKWFRNSVSFEPMTGASVKLATFEVNNNGTSEIIVLPSTAKQEHEKNNLNYIDFNADIFNGASIIDIDNNESDI